MVVLAASICTKTGKAVVSRQFVEMPQSRIEGLLASFPKLIGSSDQHTYVETETVRYVYQPLDELYMVLVTNKTSNILEDIDTLCLFARLVPDYCKSNTEREIAKNAFELIMVFDEVISLGYRENVDLGQIRTIMAMESHEERIQAEIEKNKEREAKEELKRKAKMMEMQKKEMLRKGGSSSRPYSGFGSNNSNSYSDSYQRDEKSSYSSSSMSFNTSNTNGIAYKQQTSSYNPTVPSTAPSRGLQLGRKNMDNVLLDSIKAEEVIKDFIPTTLSSSLSTQQGQSYAPQVPREGISVIFEEQISLSLNKDGGLDNNLEVKGSLLLRIDDSEKTQLSLKMKLFTSPSVQYMTHPKVDKNAFLSNATIQLRDATGGFPVGQSLGILKWRFISKEESEIPLLVSCWPSPTGNGSCDVNVEYSLLKQGMELENVVILVPWPGQEPPSVGQVDGEHYIDRQKKCIHWQLPSINSSNANGMMEFSVNSDDISGFYPIQITFTSRNLFCDSEILELQDTQGDGLEYESKRVLTSGEYVVV